MAPGSVSDKPCRIPWSIGLSRNGAGGFWRNGMSCGSVCWHEQLMPLKEAGSANAGAAGPKPARAATAAVPRSFVIITILPSMSASMILAATAVGPRKVSPLSTVRRELRTVSAYAGADEISGVVGVEVSAVDHVLGNLGLGFALIKFLAHVMTGSDGCLRRLIGDALRLQCGYEFVVVRVGANGRNCRTEGSHERCRHQRRGHCRGRAAPTCKRPAHRSGAGPCHARAFLRRRYGVSSRSAHQPRICSGVKVNRQPAPRSVIRLAPRHTGKFVGELGLGRFP